MKAVSRSIEIGAPAGVVWSILTDFEAYEAWNPFMVLASGRPQVGTRLTIVMRSPGGRTTTFRPTVLEAEPGQRLRWIGHLLVNGIFDGEHNFTIAEANTGTNFEQHETFGGLLLPLMPSVLRHAATGFEEMNEALKARAEGRTI